MADDSDDTVWFYKDNSSEWRWQRKSPNGEIVAESGEGYVRRVDCVNQAMKMFGMTVAYKERVTEDGS
jgi:hypothetical protein